MTGPGHGPTPTAQGVRGYRDLTAEEVIMINGIKEAEEALADVWGTVEAWSTTDPRWLDIARTHFQEGFSALVRSIAKPRDPFQAAFENNQQNEAEQIIPSREPSAYRRTR
jgi:hypothetical protein